MARSWSPYSINASQRFKASPFALKFTALTRLNEAVDGQRNGPRRPYGSNWVPAGFIRSEKENRAWRLF